MSYDPVERAASGAVKGALDWTADSIKNLVKKLRDGNLAFIQDEETIEIVKEQYNSGELNFFKIYIENKDMLFLVKLGLTLRRLENNIERLQNLRSKILHKYQVKGLHIAQFVENGLLNRYIGILIDNLTSVEDFKRRIMDILDNIEKYVLFVQTNDREREIIKMATTKIHANTPTVFIISGISSAAKIVKMCETTLTTLLVDYELEKISTGQKEVLFYKRKIRYFNPTSP